MVLSLLQLAAIEGGGYLSIWKTVIAVIFLLVWMRILTWIDKDAEAAFLPREAINGGFIGGALLAYAGFFLLPNFWIGLGIIIVVLGIEIGIYLTLRQKKVGLADLQDSIRASFSKGKGKEHQAIAGEVGLIGKGGGVITPPAADSPDAAGFIAVQQLLSDPLTRNAERIDMAPADGSAQIRYQVDGVPYNGPSLDLNASAAGVTYLKEIAGLDLDEKRKPQKGKFKAALGGTRHELEIQTAGSAAGEFLKIMIDPKKRHAFRMEDLGFAQDQLAKMKELVGEPDGIVIVSAPKGQGLTSSLYGILRAHDAFLQHIHTVERGADEDIEGITQNKLSANAGAEEEAKQVNWVVSQEPDIIALTSIESPASARDLIAYAGNGKRVYIGMRAGSTFQALEMWRKLVGDDALAMRNLRMVISGRVMRRLCNACKVGYTPDPDMVRKLNLDPARVGKLFQARTEPMRDQKGNPVPCTFCKELRYKGRFGFFEMLSVDDDVKQIVSSGGSVNQLKAIFRKQRSRFLQEMALLQVSEGETSVQEMLRVLRADGSGAAPAAGAGSAEAKSAGRGAGGVKPAAAKPGAAPAKTAVTRPPAKQ